MYLTDRDTSGHSDGHLVAAREVGPSVRISITYRHPCAVSTNKFLSTQPVACDAESVICEPPVILGACIAIWRSATSATNTGVDYWTNNDPD